MPFGFAWSLCRLHVSLFPGSLNWLSFPVCVPVLRTTQPPRAALGTCQHLCLLPALLCQLPRLCAGPTAGEWQQGPRSGGKPVRPSVLAAGGSWGPGSAHPPPLAPGDTACLGRAGGCGRSSGGLVYCCPDSRTPNPGPVSLGLPVALRSDREGVVSVTDESHKTRTQHT